MTFLSIFALFLFYTNQNNYNNYIYNFLNYHNKIVLITLQNNTERIRMACNYTFAEIYFFSSNC